MKRIARFLLVSFIIAGIGLSLQSCKKDDTKNNECDIMSAWVEGSQYEQYFYQSADMRIDNIPSSVTEIIFYVKSLAELPQMPVFFDITEGATITPANGSLQDFSNGAVTYTVTSEDGSNSRTYHVMFSERQTTYHHFSFEYVDSVRTNSGSLYHRFYELNVSGEKDYIWASGNEGLAIAHPDWTPDQFCTRSIADGYQGRGVCLTTEDAGTMGQMMGKPIAAGNLYIGQFDVSQLLTDPMKCTIFGMPVNKEPVKVTGYYKYQPGEHFTDAQMNIIEGRTDECNIYAVFFRNTDENGESVTLYGDQPFTSPYVVSIAQITTLPPTDEWTPFEITFAGGAADATLLASYGYSMTIVFSSSKSGDTFEGAIGSLLCIDEIDVTYK